MVATFYFSYLKSNICTVWIRLCFVTNQHFTPNPINVAFSRWFGARWSSCPWGHRSGPWFWFRKAWTCLRRDYFIIIIAERILLFSLFVRDYFRRAVTCLRRGWWPAAGWPGGRPTPRCWRSQRSPRPPRTCRWCPGPWTPASEGGNRKRLFDSYLNILFIFLYLLFFFIF